MEILNTFSKQDLKDNKSLPEIKDMLYTQMDNNVFIEILKILCSFKFGHTTFYTIIKDIGLFWENKTHWFHAIDFSIRGTDMWPHYWDSYLTRWARTHYRPNSSFDSIIYDNYYHLWFLGIKITRLETDIVRRIMRCRPSSMADLIVIQERVWWKIIPPVSEEPYTDYKKTLYLSSNDIEYWKSQGYKMAHENRELSKKIVKDETQILKTIQSNLKKRYSLEWSIKKIKRFMLNQCIPD